MAKPRSESELLDALQGLDDDLLDPSLPEEIVDAELKAAGVDPSALAASAKRLADIAAGQQRAAWHERAAKRRDDLAAKLPDTSATASMSRSQLLERLEGLRAAIPGERDAIRLAARKRKPEESSDDELRALVGEMEALRALDDE